MVKDPRYSQSQPYAHFMCTLHALYDWLRVPTTANHSLTRILCMLYTHLMRALRALYMHLMRTFCMLYDWLRVPTTANHSLTCTLRVPYAHLTCTICMLYAHLMYAS